MTPRLRYKNDKRGVNIHRVQDQPWFFNGPYRAPKIGLNIFKPLSGCVYHFYVTHSLTLFFGHYGTLPRPRGPSKWTLKWTPNGPCVANFTVPLVKRGPAECLHGWKVPKYWFKLPERQKLFPGLQLPPAGWGLSIWNNFAFEYLYEILAE